MMKAQKNHIYALIGATGLVSLIFTEDDLPEWNDALPVVDVTDITPQPQPGWSYTNDEFFPPAQPSSSQLKAEVWNRIKAERDRLTENGGVLVDGRWFDTDTKSALRYKILADVSAAQRLPDTAVLRDGWRPMDVDDRGEVAMTYGLLLRIIEAGIAQALAIDDAAQSHKAAMEASENPDNYDFSGDWPQVFCK